MDSQFNSLIQSFNTNYVQYKVTGNPSYQNGYTSAQEGLDSIINSLQEEVDNDKANISNFYKSGIEQKLNNLQATTRKLQRGILREKDDITASNMRNQQPSSLTFSAISTGQYITVGVLTIVIVGLSFL
jgi:CHASE3 domain sensor protein